MNYKTKPENRDLFHGEGNSTLNLPKQKGVASGKVTITDPHAKARVTTPGLKKSFQRGWNN